MGALGAAVQNPAANASTLSAGAGYSSAPGASGPSVALSLTIKVSEVFDIGGAADHTFLTYNDGVSGSLDFYHVIARFHILPLGGLTLDVNGGFAQRSALQQNSGYSPAAGVGMSYKIPLGDRTSLSPRVGVRYLPDSSWPVEATPTGAMVDFGVEFSFKF
jgi:hypothetical protein